MIYNLFSCKHKHLIERTWKKENGTTMYMASCPDCGYYDKKVTYTVTKEIENESY